MRTPLQDHPDASQLTSGFVEEEWQEVLAASIDRRAPDLRGYGSVFTPLCKAQKQFVIGQLGQSIDGRIATLTGDSNYVNCIEALVHLHRLRALCDAVVVGVGTAVADNPKLTVRHVSGSNPARIVIDPYGRMPAKSTLLQDVSARRIVITRTDANVSYPDGVECLQIKPDANGRLCCTEIRKVLREFRCILIEGGAWTLSRFIELNMIDRLHIMLAPLIIGSGPRGMQLPAIDYLSQAIRPGVAWYPLGTDMLADLSLSDTTPR
ncbi:Riboflavin biosynthesis protein RibD [Pseudovibrio axinellae]|uniref:Riboflavin biosynthesis protein RibD n=2 Tax=Pseudovibrio axinellae TaxID=989403 RepID=A0A165YV48_9HYPH|nr:Riboflavin biosynthesis protein RibD [Pseudovibrio axinellae]SEQ43741.1 riboflavin-specific deaminase C-terminal domain-containing protein [Pseudovibrio axinellae]